MKSVVVLSLIVVSMVIGYLATKWMQGIMQPRQSFGRLVLYCLMILILVFALSFLMVFTITRLYPDELIK